MEALTVETREVEIPALEQHDGFHRAKVALLWECPQCGGPRGEIYRGLSFDGSRRLGVDRWDNLCGHVDTYAAMRREAGSHHER